MPLYSSSPVGLSQANQAIFTKYFRLFYLSVGFRLKKRRFLCYSRASGPASRLTFGNQTVSFVLFVRETTLFVRETTFSQQGTGIHVSSTERAKPVGRINRIANAHHMIVQLFGDVLVVVAASFVEQFGGVGC